MFYKKTNGFTLIELLVVVAIISLLSSIVMASLGSARDKGKESNIIQTLVQVRNGLELYVSTFGIYPKEKENFSASHPQAPGMPYIGSTFASFVNNYLVVNKFMSTAPIGPGGQSESSSSFYYYFTRSDLSGRRCENEIASRYVLGVYSTKPLKLPRLFSQLYGGFVADYYCITTQ